ncbi:carbonic anhydrase 1 [Nephila pilipes]|uniref:Carbonic anhydrase n=1 Tax=Nephila pilipes TaxID=299642 RepID=A0A8X6U0A5_NEPPI|nr:carbonic anhydrase 1 [Nephila pilipes]
MNSSCRYLDGLKINLWEPYERNLLTQSWLRCLEFMDGVAPFYSSESAKEPVKVDPSPDTWASKYPQAGGQNQSPVDIVTSSIQPRSFESPLSWKYGTGICKTVVNTGCGWRVDVQGSDSDLSGGPLSDSYELVQFHSHWGNDTSCGSEHTIDGKSFAGELHFVHWNRGKFTSCTEAVPSPTGLTVIAVFLEGPGQNWDVLGAYQQARFPNYNIVSKNSNFINLGNNLLHPRQTSRSYGEVPGEPPGKQYPKSPHDHGFFAKLPN